MVNGPIRIEQFQIVCQSGRENEFQDIKVRNYLYVYDILSISSILMQILL